MTPGRHVRTRTAAAPVQSASRDAETTEASPPEITVRDGNPTPPESAAVLAAVAAAIDDGQADAQSTAPSAPSAWDRSRRGLRAPLQHGSWRGFTGIR